MKETKPTLLEFLIVIFIIFRVIFFIGCVLTIGFIAIHFLAKLW